MRRLIPTLLLLAAAALGLSGCFSPAAKAAPDSATLDCLVLVGQGTGSHLLTDKANAVANGWGDDTNADVYCDVAAP